MSKNQSWQSMVQSKLTRRSFLRGIGVFSAGVAARSVVSAPENTAQAASQSPTPSPALAQDGLLPFAPIEPTALDDITLPLGFNYQVVIARGDVFTPDGKTFGDNADWTGWFPIDWLEDGESVTEGLLVINCEYLTALFVSGYEGEGEKTPEQIEAEKGSVGFSVVHLRRDENGWTVVADSEFARRFDATVPIELTGPVAGTDAVNGATTVTGTLANCSGGKTLWKTGLSCEENYQLFWGNDKNATSSNYRWVEDSQADEIAEHYGWVVEIDPYTGVAKKRTSMGRFHHENVAMAIGSSGRVVCYMGDDAQDEVVYKFISEGVYNPDDREANLDILETGTLYAANFGKGRWIPVVWEGNEETLGDPDEVGGYAMSGLADVLTYANQAARALGATPVDRPEDIEIHPTTGDIYIAFTNNSRHGNFHGQITRIMENDGDHESLEFGWDIFAVGGPQSGFSSPDNMAFDPKGNLWMVTDISTSSVNSGIYEFQGNNAMFMFPTEGENAGKAYMFASAPNDAEMTGPTFVGSDTLFLAVQHPGELTPSLDELTSHWPDGGDSVPRAGVVAITGPFGN